VTEDVTDDAAMVERLGLPVKIFMGSYSNHKITTLEDLALARAWLAVGGKASA
jgi:2-C-methyl-D-erythritol 4-phosphate cytidylyltransferase